MIEILPVFSSFVWKSSPFPVKMWRTPTFLALVMLVALLLWLSAAKLYQETRPRIGQGIVEIPGQLVQPFNYPFLQKQVPKTKFVLKEEIDLPYLYPTTFDFYPKDALWTVKVNGHAIQAQGLPLSVTHHEGRTISLDPFLHSGRNEIELGMEVYWDEASLNMSVSPWDKYSLICSVLVLSATFTTSVFFCSFFKIKLSGYEILALMGGFIVRYLYFLGTPYYIRAYDWWGHTAYLDFVVQHSSLPDPHANWEAFQPPLYYLLVGGLTKLLLLCGMAEDQRYALWQGFSFVCSLGVPMAGLWIGRVVYPSEIRYRPYVVGVLSLTPFLVFNAAQISNDALVNALVFLWLGFLLLFWKQPTSLSWLGLSLVLGLALLTKANTLVLIPISVLCLILKREVAWQSKIRASVALGLILIGIAGWYYLPRAFHESAINSYVVGNINHLNPKSHIDGIFAKSLVFNPFKVVRYPFVQPWGPRHEYFLEYYFKSIFVGEWYLGPVYKWVARSLILTALLLVPAFFLGMYHSLKSKSAYGLPLAIITMAVFAAQWVFVQIAPYMSSQNFRFSAVVLVPMVYFFTQGVSKLSGFLGSAHCIVLQLLLLNCGIYILELALEG